MSSGKIGALVVYAVLAIIAVTQAGTTAGTVVNWMIVVLVATHLVEMIFLFGLCRKAPGSLAGNLLQVFVFGYFHTVEMKAALQSG
jgi:uncharacterized protein YhhL (DUF1145 family)